MPQFVPPSFDRVFKHVFADPQDLAPLKSLLGAALDIAQDDLSGLQLVDREVRPDYISDKLGVLDVGARTSAGDEIDIEMQEDSHEGFDVRLAFYAARLLIQQGHMGRDYAEMRQVICIAITNFRLTGNHDSHSSTSYHHRFHLHDASQNVGLTNIIQIDLLELPRLPASPDGTLLWYWLRFIGSRSRKEMEMTAVADPVISAAVRKVNAFTDDDLATQWAEARLLRDQIAWNTIVNQKARESIAEALAEGLAEGKAKGKAEGLAEGEAIVIRAMLARGHTASDVARLTGMTEAHIEAIAAASDGPQ